MKESIFVYRARQRSGLTQSEVARELGYDSPQFISNIERGLVELPNDKVRDFCRITKASLVAFVRVKIFSMTRDIRKEILG